VKSSRASAGLLLFRRGTGGLELFLAHPGGPFWQRRDGGAACREFKEETGLSPEGPFIPLGSVRQKAGKVVHAWAWEGNADPATIASNTVQTEWPRGSGRWLTYPEVDRCAWFDRRVAREKINPAQAALIDRLETELASLEPRPR
jgi:predicted NUDIX family NTP pyrophosphohydrolase